MKVLAWTVAICLTSLVLGEIITLTDDNFDRVTKTGVVMVKFYVPWCPHCQSLAPEFEKVAKQAKDQNKTYVFAEMSGNVGYNTPSKHKVSGYPALRLFMNGAEMDYRGPRTAESIMSYIEERVKFQVPRLSTPAEVKAVVDAKGRRCILVSNRKNALKDFTRIAITHEQYKFYVAGSNVTKGLLAAAERLPYIVVLRDFEEPSLLYTRPITESDFGQFLNERMFGTVASLDAAMTKHIHEHDDPKAFVLVRSLKNASNSNIDAEFTEFAKLKHKDGYKFVLTDMKASEGQEMLNYMGVEEYFLPVLEYMNRQGSINRYRHKGNFTLAGMLAFFEEVKQNKVSPSIRSQPSPTSQDGPVYKLVGETFVHDVMQNDLDVLVKFYADWCNHCQALAPTYSKLAHVLRENPRLRIAEIDAAKNEIPGEEIKGYPTIKLFPGKNKGSPIPFNGARTVEGFIQFLKDNASYPIEEIDEEPKQDL